MSLGRQILVWTAAAALLAPYVALAGTLAPDCPAGACCSMGDSRPIPPCHRGAAAVSAAMTCCQVSPAEAVPPPSPPSVEAPDLQAAAVVGDALGGGGAASYSLGARYQILEQRRAIGLFTLHSSFLN